MLSDPKKAAAAAVFLAGALAVVFLGAKEILSSAMRAYWALF